MNRHRGFTLVEMAVVLVIIGLIIGAIAVGRDLIAATQIRMAIAQIEKYKTAVNTFKVKYNALPGDMTEAQADDVGFTVPPARFDTATYGQFHGDGQIESGDTTTCYDQYLIGEDLTFWEDLSSAGLIAEHFTKATEPATATSSAGSSGNLTTATLAGFVPASAIGNNNWVLAYGIPQGCVRTWMQPYTPAGNYFQLAGVTTEAHGMVTMQNNLTPTQAQNIDTKIDDGAFATGTVRASAWAVFLTPAYPAANCATLAVGYQTALYPNTPGCQLSFAF